MQFIDEEISIKPSAELYAMRAFVRLFSIVLEPWKLIESDVDSALLTSA